METIIQNTENMKKLLLRYGQENKCIINYHFYANQVRVLAREKKVMHIKAPKMTQKKIKSDNQSEDGQSHSRISSEDQQFTYKYFIRGFKFYFSRDT